MTVKKIMSINWKSGNRQKVNCFSSSTAVIGITTDYDGLSGILDIARLPQINNSGTGRLLFPIVSTHATLHWDM
jgi:hypothetical protein